MYVVIVGNIGTVLESHDGALAQRTFTSYYQRALTEFTLHGTSNSVTLMHDGEVVREHPARGIEE